MATPAGVPGCTKLLSVFAVHAFLSTFRLLGFGFTIHCLVTTNTSCSVVNIILASSAADPSRVNLLLHCLFSLGGLGFFGTSHSFGGLDLHAFVYHPSSPLGLIYRSIDLSIYLSIYRF